MQLATVSSLISCVCVRKFNPYGDVVSVEVPNETNTACEHNYSLSSCKMRK